MTLTAPPQFTVITAEDADGGLRLSVFGEVTAESLGLRDIVIAALHSQPPRVEVDLAGLAAIDDEGARFLLACGRMAKNLAIEYRLTRFDARVAYALARQGYGPALT